MRKIILTAAALLLLIAFLTPLESFATLGAAEDLIALQTPVVGRVPPQSIYVRLEALEEGNVIFYESLPSSISNYVATINVSLLGVMVSKNVNSAYAYADDVGNLWLSANYTLKQGEYIEVLVWASSESVEGNKSLPESIPFPSSYPDDVKPFLVSGTKIPSDNASIKQLAQSLATQDMIQTVRNILNYVNSTQTYDRAKVLQLMTGQLNVTNVLNFINDPLTSLETGTSFCFERALLATAMLRAVGIPTRTFSNHELKTWVQVWLPSVGWVDGEVLCVQSGDYALFPRSLAYVMPRMVQNSSDAMFPFFWSPNIRMRIANLTLGSFDDLTAEGYGIMFSQPVIEDQYKLNPNQFSFSFALKPQAVRAAFTVNGSDFVLHLKGESSNLSKLLTVGSVNNVEFEGIQLSFKPMVQNNLLILLEFSAHASWGFNYWLLVPFIVAVPVVFVFWSFRNRRRAKR